MKEGSQNFTLRLSCYLLRWRWWVVTLLALITVSFEILEHFTMPHPVDAHFWRELVVFGILGPLLGGLGLSLLQRAQMERTRAVGHLNRHHELNQQLVGSLDWDELARVLVKFPSSVAPFTGASLLVYERSPARFELAAEWWDLRGDAPLSPMPFQAPDFCRACGLAKSGVSPAIVPCNYLENACLSSRTVPARYARYCLPLVHGAQLIALLQLYMPAEAPLTDAQTEILNSLAPSMALAIDGARPQPAASVHAAVVRAERQRIARELHDTLGQNLGYLRFKLDQLTDGNTLGEIVAIRQELERMRDIANEAYQQVRGTLTVLRPNCSAELTTALLALAQSVGARANFEVELTCEGQSRPLPEFVQRQILELFREALFNVERHANAERVTIRVLWTEEVLTIRLADDGRGFEPERILPNGHYGLTIMRERAEEIDAAFVLSSQLGMGTELTLRLPLNSVPQAKCQERGGNGV